MSILFILCGTSRISLRRKEWALLEFLTLNFAQFCEDFHAAIFVSCSTSAQQAASRAVIILLPFEVSRSSQSRKRIFFLRHSLQYTAVHRKSY